MYPFYFHRLRLSEGVINYSYKYNRMLLYSNNHFFYYILDSCFYYKLCRDHFKDISYLLIYYYDANKRVRLVIKQTKLVGVLKTTREPTCSRSSEVGQGAKMTKERTVGVIGTHGDNDPNSYFASYIYTMHVCECVSVCIRAVFRK